MADHDDIPPTEPVSGDDTSDMLGPYHLVRRIGEGGMGEVFLADQREPIRRRVAIKVIKAGMDTREVIARFESERQALALMNHPNVAKIHDAGATDAGRPYFVMEYVAGESITGYCDRERLSIEERLRLFVPLCEAIHHAHQKGIIHRDIKPTNVLVAEVDGTPVAKVIDFGVAKAISQPLTEKTLFTAQGQMLGTPAYMSPEQAEMTGMNVDTTSDVYSLGVLLYELLSGAQPFDASRLRQAGIAEIHRIIREVDPPRPSTRVDSLGDQATTLADHRHVQPRDWVRSLRGELDWITMRAMAKERARRYQSALALAEDIDRHLHHEPVEAGPPDVRYRFGKFARRHRVLLASAAAIVLVLLVAITAVSILYVGSERARADAEWNQHVVAMQLAGSAYDARAAQGLADALERSPETHRGWGWQWLHDQLDKSDGVLWTSPSPITSAEFLLEHDLVAVGRADGMVSLLDVRRRTVVDSARVSLDAVNQLALSPDGRRMATQHLSTDSIRVRDIESGEILLELIPPEGWDCFTRTIFSSSGEELLIYGDGLRAYALQGGSPRTIAADANPPDADSSWQRGACLGPAARRLESGSIVFARIDGALLELDADAQVLETRRESDDPRTRVRDLVAGPWETLTYETSESAPASTTAGGRERRSSGWIQRLAAYSLDPRTDRRIIELDTRVSSICASGDGQWAAVGGPGGVLTMYGLIPSQKLGSFVGHQDWIIKMAVTDDDSKIVTASSDRTLRSWAVTDLVAQVRPVLTLSQNSAIATDPAGTRFMVSGLTGVHEIGPTSALGALPQSFATPEHKFALDVSWHPDGEFVVAAATDWLPFGGHGSPGRGRAVYVYGEQEPIMMSDDLAVLREPGQAAFSHDGRRLAWAFNRGEVAQAFLQRDPRMKGIEAKSSEEGLEIWDVDRRIVLRGFECDAPQITALSWSADDRHLYFADGDYDVHVLRVEDGAILHTLAGHRGVVKALAGDPSGRYLASAAHDSTARVWDLETGDALSTLKGHSQTVYDVIFAPGGRQVVTVSSDETVRVWDFLRGTQITSVHVEGAGSLGLQMAVHPDGSRVLLAGTMRFWEFGARE